MNCYDALLLTSDVFEQYVILAEGLLPEIERFKMIQSYITVSGLIHHETAEPSLDVVDDKNNENDSGVGDSEGEDPQTEGEPGTSKAICDSNVQKTEVHKDSDLLDEAKDSKIKLIHLKYIKTLLGYIKFNNMTKNDVYNVIGKSNLLNFKEKFDALYLTTY
nr:uncharacterized protein LOC118877417 isoform X1 [Drosophila suzukii]XP_036672030.1 uncharacterized protein LOC118877417 isoform X2 [Drosophila suzukii]